MTIAETLAGALEDDRKRREAGSAARLRKTKRAEATEAVLQEQRELQRVARAERAEKDAAEELERRPKVVRMPLSVVTGILDGKTYSTATATAIAANTADALASLAGQWASPIEHILYRTSKGAFFERFYQRLTPLTEKEALSLYGMLKYQLAFPHAFPNLTLEDA